MSLLRLLKAGRSLVNPRESGSRYHMRRKIQLPKFGSAKNPFSARSETPAVPAAPGAIISERPREMSAAEVAAARLKETVRLPVTELPAPLSPPAPAAPARAWWNPFTWRRSAGVGSIRVGSVVARPAVQGELSLDQIRVVRNDLSDSDVEIVQPEPAMNPRGVRAVSEPRTALEEAPRA